jgi:peptidoglycan hydrolase-like protein with peptidoglycan-binding domain
MAARKRKPPKKQGAGVVLLRLAVRGGGRTAAVIGRHPSLFGGTLAFAVIFGFVAANALWYQPNEHPAPILRTRTDKNPNGIAGLVRKPNELPESNVTTFRIERETGSDLDSTQTAAVHPLERPAPDDAGVTASVPKPDVLVGEIQGELAKRGLYDGAIDGLDGPRTSAAISTFEQRIGLKPTGEARDDILVLLQSGIGKTAAADTKPAPAAPVVVPAARPTPELSDRRPAPSTKTVAVAKPQPKVPVSDPVADAIRQASAKPPAAAPVTKASAPANANASDLVTKIQRGLSNIAYADIKVDGVAGGQTRAAIRHFEKHYRLPVTGEPNAAVLKKLQQIGAL